MGTHNNQGQGGKRARDPLQFLLVMMVSSQLLPDVTELGLQLLVGCSLLGEMASGRLLLV